MKGMVNMTRTKFDRSSLNTWFFGLVPLILFLLTPHHQERTDASFSMYCNRIYTPNESAAFIFQGVNIRERVHFRLYHVSDPISFFSTRERAHTPAAMETKDQGEWLNVVSSFPVVREWEEAIKQRHDQWMSMEITLGATESGVYLVEARAHGKIAFTNVIISPFALITKQSKNQLLAFVIDRKTGTAIADANVVIVRKNRKLAEGKSSKNGLFFASVSLEREEGEDPSPFMRGRVRPVVIGNYQLSVMAQRGKHFIIANPWWYGYGRESDYLIYTYTERPVYRPAQEIFFKGVVRRKSTRSALVPVSDTWVKVRVRDARGGELYSDSLRTNANGTYAGSLSLSETAPLGMYSIETSVSGTIGSANFEVQEYKKPEYEVTVSTPKQQYTKGETINAAIKALYYFGSPVSGARVEYMVYRSRYWRPWWIGTEYEWFYESAPELYSYQQEMISTGSRTLDQNGELNVEIKTDRKASSDYVYRIEANVTDLSRRTIAGSTAITVTRGLFTVTIRTDKYVYRRDEESRVTISVQDLQGNGVAVPYRVRVSREWWERTPVVNDRTRYDYTHHSDSIFSVKGNADKNGNAVTHIVLGEPGYYTITVSADDPLGNTIAESINVYAAEKGAAAWWGVNQGIQIIPDKQSYEVGETVHALVIVPVANVDVLLSAEADRIIDHKVEHFETAAKMVSMPIKEAHAPNFYLGVAALVGDQLYHMTKSLHVLPQEKFLHVEILNSKETYKPAEQGVITVKVSDHRGRPVRNAEFSLGIVDESIYAVSPDKVPDIRRFFYGNRWNTVQTSSSLYFSSYGYGELMAADAANGRMALRSEVTREASEQQMGGQENKPQFVPAVLRKDFRDMMHWTPTLITDEQGIAQIQVKYPDNLTTWRATVRIVTRDTRVGSSTAKVVVRKNLLVRMETPRFLTERDSIIIATIVHNYLHEDKIARVALKAQGAKLLGNEQSLKVPRDGEVRLDWKLAANEAGTVTLVAEALTDEESDAVQVQLPVLAHGVQITQAQVVDLQAVNEGKSVLITIPDEAELATAKVVVRLSPSLASSILTALDDLVGYPYGCVEQTMSRFLPTIVVANTLKDFNVPLRASLKEELPKMVDTGLKRLYALQHSDGGWGWWENDNTDAFMTSYVVYGLTLAHLAGYSISETALSRGVERMQHLLTSSEKLDPTTKAYAMYVLAFASSNGVSVNKSTIASQLAKFDLDNANNYTRSLVALASYYRGDRTAASSVASVLEASATHTGTSVFWTGKAWHYNWQDDNVETTAFVVKALLAARGNSEIVQQAVHWLLKQKRGGSWLSTKQTAIVILALVDYLKTSKELEPEYTVTLTVNGMTAHTQRISKAMLFDKEPSVEVAGKMLKKGINTLRVEKEGKGKLYCTVHTGYYSMEENIEEQKSGFAVKREYFKLIRVKRGNEYVYEKQPLRGPAHSGEELFVKLTLSSDGNYEYFILEDPLAPGVEVVKDERNYKIIDEKDYQYDPWYHGWRYWWASKEVRDEKVAFFARNINAGTHTFSYIARAQIPGRYHVMPALGSLMYYPEVRGNSEEVWLEIR